MKSKLAVAIKAGLVLKGITQASLARQLNVSETTVSNWMQSRNRPDRESLYGLKSYFRWSEEKLGAIVEDWYENGYGMKSYRVAGHDFVVERFNRDYVEFQKYLIEMDLDTIGGLSPEYEGTPEQWAPIFESSPDTWRLLILGEEIVGYWHFMCLKDPYFSSLKNGTMIDAELRADMLDFPVTLGHYKAYFNIITLRASEQNSRAFSVLLKSLEDVILGFARDSIFFSDICATAFSFKGKRLCEHIGMSFVKRHPRAPENEVADIFFMTGAEVSEGYLGRNKSLAKAYVSEFGRP